MQHEELPNEIQKCVGEERLLGAFGWEYSRSGRFKDMKVRVRYLASRPRELNSDRLAVYRRQGLLLPFLKTRRILLQRCSSSKPTEIKPKPVAALSTPGDVAKASIEHTCSLGNRCFTEVILA